jgi:hypothetical protein
MVDSCCLGIVRIFNIISLHFREQGGTNLLLSIATLGRWQAGPITVAMGRWQPSPIATMIGPSCRWSKVATGKRCSHLPVAILNLKLLYLFAIEIHASLWHEICEQSLCSNWYFCNIIIQVVIHNIVIYFISIAYTTTTMHQHTSFSINFRWSTIMSILYLSTTTLGIAWTVVRGEWTVGIGGICSVMSPHWKDWQPLAWNTRLTTHSLTLNRSKHKHACIWKDA